MKTAAAFVIGVILGAGALAVFSGYGLDGGAPPSPAPSLPPPSTTLAAAMCEGLVRLSVQGTTIVATPDNVCLAVGRSLTWEIVDQGTVTVDFEEFGGVKGPFPRDVGNLLNPERGKYRTNATGNIRSNNAEMLPRPWKYTVHWKLPTGEELPPLDPVVCIRR